MFFWFIGTAILTIGLVFRDPRFDYRLLIVGSVLPIVDGAFGNARALHSVVTSVGLLTVLMIATSGRRPIRKVLLGLPIGMILHLVFSGVWNDTEVFWWPLFGWSFDESALPILERGWWALPMEAVGVALCVWLWRHNGLADSDRRARFRRDGQLDAVPERFA